MEFWDTVLKPTPIARRVGNDASSNNAQDERVIAVIQRRQQQIRDNVGTTTATADTAGTSPKEQQPPQQLLLIRNATNGSIMSSTLPQHSTDAGALQAMEIPVNIPAFKIVQAGETHLRCKFPGCRRVNDLKNSKEFKSHLITHCTIRPFACQFSGCEKTCKRHRDFVQHQKWHKSQDPSWKRQNLQQRQQLEKQQLEKQRQWLSAQLKQQKPQKWPKVLQQPQQPQSTGKSTRRLVLGLTSKRFACSIKGCHKAFTTKSNRKQHEIIHQYPSSVCQLCQTRFKRRLELHSHMRVHASRSVMGNLPLPPPE